MNKHFKQLLWALPIVCGLIVLGYFLFNHVRAMYAIGPDVPAHLILLAALAYAFPPALMGVFTGLQLSVVLFIARWAFLRIQRQWRKRAALAASASLPVDESIQLKEPLEQTHALQNDR